MSDYLSNLVARNLGWANTVQPRVRSLFEPTAEEDFSNLRQGSLREYREMGRLRDGETGGLGDGEYG